MRDFVFENNSLPHQDHRTERWFGKETDRFARGSAEQERENMRHCMLLHLRGGRNLYLPPLRDLQLILDIGTGTGSWSIDSTSPLRILALKRTREHNITPVPFSY